MKYEAPNQNPYDQGDPSLQPETPPFDEILRSFVDQSMQQLRVCYPAKITAVKGNQKVDVQPLLQGRLIDGTVRTLSVVQNCLVSMPMGQNWGIKVPIAVGDLGWCIVADRSLDDWAYSSGDVTLPQDPRSHEMVDSIFIPGLVPFPMQSTDKTSDLVVNNGPYQFRVSTDKITLAKNGVSYTAVLGEPLAAILGAIISQFNEHVHTGNLGAPTTPPTVEMNVPDLTDGKELCKDGGGF